MNFLHYEVNAQIGEVVQVVLTGNAANVFLLDENNFQRYKSKQQYQYYGGYYTQSPALIRVPAPGRWHVVVDLGGSPGTVNAAVQLQRAG